MEQAHNNSSTVLELRWVCASRFHLCCFRFHLDCNLALVFQPNRYLPHPSFVVAADNPQTQCPLKVIPQRCASSGQHNVF